MASPAEWRIDDIERLAQNAAPSHAVDALRSDVACLERTVGGLSAACDGLRATCEALLSRIEAIDGDTWRAAYFRLQNNDGSNATGLFALARECGWSEFQSRPAYLFIRDRISAKVEAFERGHEGACAADGGVPFVVPQSSAPSSARFAPEVVELAERYAGQHRRARDVANPDDAAAYFNAAVTLAEEILRAASCRIRYHNAP